MLGLLSLLLIKSLLLIVVLAVFWLAVRRLLLSRSANAWLYAATSIFSLMTLLGLLPWALGIGTTHPVFFVFAAMTPTVWYGVVTMCNATRPMRYDSELERTILRFLSLARVPRFTEPLVLVDPKWPEAPMPVFRHTAPEIPDTNVSRPVAKAAVAERGQKAAPVGETRRSRVSEATRSLLGVARGMRRNESSEIRRIKLLPPPMRTEDRSIPFLKAPESV